jgi:hypothetical protein
MRQERFEKDQFDHVLEPAYKIMYGEEEEMKERRVRNM